MPELSFLIKLLIFPISPFPEIIPLSFLLGLLDLEIIGFLIMLLINPYLVISDYKLLQM
jgi:hypothetical protein